MMPQRRPGPQDNAVSASAALTTPSRDKIVHLPAKGGLQAIGDMPRHLLVQPDRLLPHGRIEFPGALDRLFGGLCATDDLDQRHKVGRVEGMPDHAALGMRGAPRLDLAHRQAGGARRNDHVGRQQLVELPIELFLEIDPLGPVLLDEVGAFDRGSQGRRVNVSFDCDAPGARPNP